MKNELLLQRIQAVNGMLKETPKPGVTWRQQIISVAVRYCYLMYPEAMEQHHNVVGRHKENLVDQKFGTAKDSKAEMRAVFNVPTYLNMMIHELLQYFCPGEPLFGEIEEEVAWFFKEYPQFRIADKY